MKKYKDEIHLHINKNQYIRLRKINYHNENDAWFSYFHKGRKCLGEIVLVKSKENLCVVVHEISHAAHFITWGYYQKHIKEFEKEDTLDVFSERMAQTAEKLFKEYLKKNDSF